MSQTAIDVGVHRGSHIARLSSWWTFMASIHDPIVTSSLLNILKLKGQRYVQWSTSLTKTKMNVKQTKQKDRRKTLYIRFKYLYHMKGPDNFTKMDKCHWPVFASSRLDRKGFYGLNRKEYHFILNLTGIPSIVMKWECLLKHNSTGIMSHWTSLR